MGSPIGNDDGRANREPYGTTGSGEAVRDTQGARGRETATFNHLRQGEWSVFSSGGTGASNVADASRRPVQPERTGVPSTRGGDSGAFDIASVTAFLRAYPSKEALGKTFPELASMALSPQADAAAFEAALKDILGPDRFTELTAEYPPAAILGGLLELAARRGRSETVPAPRRGKVETAEPEKTETVEAEKTETAEAEAREPARPPTAAKGAVPKPQGSAVLHYLAGRETGARRRPAGDDGLAGKLAAVRHDRCAALGILTGHDVSKLASRYREIETLGRILKEDRPDLWKFFKSYMGEYGNIKLKRIYETCEETIFLKAADVVLGTNKEHQNFFQLLISLETTVRFLKVLSDCRFKMVEDSDDAEEIELNGKVVTDCEAEIIEKIASKAAFEIMAGLLRTEKASAGFDGRNGFEKALTETLLYAYETKDLLGAANDFRSRMKSAWPEVPALDDAASETDSDFVKTARRAVAMTKAYDMPALTLSKEIVYYCAYLKQTASGTTDPFAVEILIHRVLASADYLTSFAASRD